MTPQTPTPIAPIAPVTPAAPNTALFAQPGENFAQYEARVAGGNSGNAPAGPTTPTVTPEDHVAQSLGYKDYADASQQLTAPTANETKLYNDAYSAAGLDQLQSTITGKQNDLTDALGKINDNPWLDEASRVGRGRIVQQLATADIKNYQTEYANKLKEVQDLVKSETADGTLQTTANKAKLAALETQAKDLAAQSKIDNAAPKTVKGSTSGTTYQWNPTTQKFEPTIPQTPKSPSSASSKSPSKQDISKIGSAMQSFAGQDGFVSPQTWQQALNEWTAAGYSSASFASAFKGYANVKDKTNNYAGLK